LLTWARVCFDYNRCSFKYCTNTFSLMCRSRGKRLVINSSYHINISSIINSRSYNITYTSWLATSFSYPPFTMLVSYHWRFRYPFASMHLREWTYNSSQYISGHCSNYCFREWSTCLEGSLPPFPSPHSTMSWYFYH
jgi:hypothetical protein